MFVTFKRLVVAGCKLIYFCLPGVLSGFMFEYLRLKFPGSNTNINDQSNTFFSPMLSLLLMPSRTFIYPAISRFKQWFLELHLFCQLTLACNEGRRKFIIGSFLSACSFLCHTIPILEEKVEILVQSNLRQSGKWLNLHM